MFRITDMTLAHLDEVYAIETRSFAVPWSRSELRKEIDNKHAVYKVAIAGYNDKVAGYAGMWHVVNEGHITNIAVGGLYRRKGAASLLMEALIGEAERRHMIGLTLEVRASNVNAQGLYKKYGFVPEGIRKGYYAASPEGPNTREDAVIMWKYFEVK